MKQRLLTILLALALLLVVGVIWGWKAAPRLVESFPKPGAESVSARTSLRLTFSRLMSLDSAAAHIQIDPYQAGTYTWEGNSLVYTPNRPWPNEQEIKVTIRLGARQAAFPGLPLLKSTSWSFKTGKMQLAYLWPSEGSADLYALDAQSGEIQRLTENAAVLDFHYVPGQTVLFLSADDGHSGSRIFQYDFMAESNNQALKLLIECPLATCRNVQASPDGQWLVYERTPLEASGETVVSSVRLFSLSKHESQLAGEAGHDTTNPTWSQDGWLAFYDQQAQEYVLMMPGGPRQTRLPNQTGEAGNWQPESLAFVAPEVFIENTGLLEPVSTRHLIRYDLAQPGFNFIGQEDISLDFYTEDGDPVFSPDGRQIAFSRHYLDPSRWTPGRQMWIMQADGSQAQALSSEEAYNHYDFIWSPDGSQIAFVRSDPTQLTQPPELWLVNPDGSNPIQLVKGGYSPIWIP